jgi:uncharacterized membrane protein YkoI
MIGWFPDAAGTHSGGVRLRLGGMMKRRTLTIGGIAAAAVLVAGGAFGIAAATGGDDDEPITGPAYQKAVDAALAHTGGGTVAETEVGDEDSMYEVEVTLPDGSSVDVQLDEQFQVVSDEVDDESEDGDDAD